MKMRKFKSSILEKKQEMSDETIRKTEDESTKT